MNFIEKYVKPEDYKDMLETFEPFVFENMNESNFWKIANYLKLQNITVIEGIVTDYFPLFLIDVDVFIKKFEKLKSNYSNINDALINDLSILEDMYE